MKQLMYACVAMGFLATSFAQTPAFPGAEGFGAATTGGRGGQVIYVTNLNCSGPGSLNEALSMPGSKYILFAVSGIIDCAAEVVEGNCYIAGQTSPNGIIVRGIIADDYYNPAAHPDNVIIRHLRSRGIGTHPSANTATDPIVISGVTNMIVDHCSFSNSDDEAVDISRTSQLTVQNCLLAETVGSHFDLGGMLFNYSTPGNRMDSISIHHNNWNRLGGRMPEFSCEDPSGCTGSTFHIEYSCNLLWDQQRVIYHNIDTDLSNGSDPGFVEPYYLNANFVNNYGMSRPSYCEAMFLNTFLETAQNQLYTNGNKHNRYPSYADYELFNCCSDFCTQGAPNSNLGVANLLSNRHPFPAITYTDALDLPTYMVDNVGAFPRFPHETRLMNAVATNTFDNASLSVNAVDDILDLLPTSNTLPTDSDNDGMPDYWETAHGLNPSVADHNGSDVSVSITGISGYTNLECYLNCLADALVNGTTPNCGVTLGLNEQPASPGSFQLYPNPASTTATLLLSAPTDSAIAIYSANGRLVKTISCNNETTLTFSTGDLSDGIYFVQFNNATEKLVIKH